jgi:hypothetical protein
LAAGRARLTPWPAQGRLEDGRRWSLALWVLSPMTVLYTATSADAVFAVALAGAALAAHRGLVRRSWAWTLTGGALLWVGSMLTYAAVLLLVFLLVRAAGRLGREPGWVLRWAAGTAGTVLGLAGLLWLTTGYDPVASVRAVHAAYQAAPGSASRPYLPWLVGDPIAFGGMLGIPLFAALAARAAAVVRQRAWTCFDAAMLACLLAASSWGSPGARSSASSCSWCRWPWCRWAGWGAPARRRHPAQHPVSMTLPGPVGPTARCLSCAPPTKQPVGAGRAHPIHQLVAEVPGQRLGVILPDRPVQPGQR